MMYIIKESVRGYILVFNHFSCKKIIDKVKKLFDEDIFMVGVDGIIIVSTDAQRIGTYPEGAMISVTEKRRVIIKKEDEQYLQGVKTGIIDHDQEPWFSVTLIVDEERKLKVNYDYIDWSETEFGPTVRLKYFQYNYLNKLPKDEKELFEKMNDYEKNKK